MRVSGSSLVARWRLQRLTRGSHDVAGLRWRMLRKHCGGSLIHRWFRVLTGALSTQGHLGELRCQLFSLEKVRMILIENQCDCYHFISTLCEIVTAV